jgi:hypothetical protein
MMNLTNLTARNSDMGKYAVPAMSEIFDRFPSTLLQPHENKPFSQPILRNYLGRLAARRALRQDDSLFFVSYMTACMRVDVSMHRVR